MDDETKGDAPFARQIEAFHSLGRAKMRNEGRESLYLKTLWRPELAHFSAADYLDRRDFFFNLCRFVPLEHPILKMSGGVRARVAETRKKTLPSFDAKPFGAYDMFGFEWVEISDAIARDRVVYNTFHKAQRDILRCLYEQFDKQRLGLGFIAEAVGGPGDHVNFRPKVLPTTTQKRFAAFGSEWAARTGKPACFVYSRMYRAPENDALDVPPTRLQKRAKVPTLSGGPGCSLTPASRIDVLEAACATLPRDPALPLAERAALVDAFCDSLALTWETVPLFDLRDLDAWAGLCCKIDGIYGKTLSPGTMDETVEYLGKMGIAFTKGRFLALDLLWDETKRGHYKIYHLQPGWKNRIKTLKEIRAEQTKRGLLS